MNNRDFIKEIYESCSKEDAAYNIFATSGFSVRKAFEDTYCVYDDIRNEPYQTGIISVSEALLAVESWFWTNNLDDLRTELEFSDFENIPPIIYEDWKDFVVKGENEEFIEKYKNELASVLIYADVEDINNFISIKNFAKMFEKEQDKEK